MCRHGEDCVIYGSILYIILGLCCFCNIVLCVIFYYSSLDTLAWVVPLTFALLFLSGCVVYGTILSRLNDHIPASCCGEYEAIRDDWDISIKLPPESDESVIQVATSGNLPQTSGSQNEEGHREAVTESLFQRRRIFGVRHDIEVRRKNLKRPASSSFHVARPEGVGHLRPVRVLRSVSMSRTQPLPSHRLLLLRPMSAGPLRQGDDYTDISVVGARAEPRSARDTHTEGSVGSPSDSDSESSCIENRLPVDVNNNRQYGEVLSTEALVKRAQTDSNLRTLADLLPPDGGLCIVCYEKVANVSLDSCTHIVLCEICAEKVLEEYGSCPICLQPAQEMRRLVFITPHTIVTNKTHSKRTVSPDSSSHPPTSRASTERSGMGVSENASQDDSRSPQTQECCECAEFTNGQYSSSNSQSLVAVKSSSRTEEGDLCESSNTHLETETDEDTAELKVCLDESSPAGSTSDYVKEWEEYANSPSIPD